MALTAKFTSCTMEEDSYETNKCATVFMFAFLLPSLFTETIIGLVEWKNADEITCLDKYDAYVIYVVMMIYSFSFSFIYFIIVSCVILPKCIHQRRNRRTL